MHLNVCYQGSQSSDGVAVTSISAPLIKSVQPRYNGMFINGSLNNINVSFLIDTGAEPTVISRKVLACLPKSVRTKFYDNISKLQTADGADLPANGPVLCELTIERRTVIETIYAANISDSAILGLAAMEALGLELSIAGIKVLRRLRHTPIRRIFVPQIRCVIVARNCKILARSEAVFSAVCKSKINCSDAFMVTHRSNLSENSFFVARIVVKPNDNNCAVRIMNTSDTVRKLKRGTIIAEAEPVTVVDSLSDDLPVRPHNNQFHDLSPHLKSLYHETREREQLDQPTRIGLK